MSKRPPIYLASRSPRRLELLRQIGIEPRVVSADVDEIPRPGESPEAYVRRLAVAKARAVRDGLSPGDRAAVLGADTAVIDRGAVLGKPRNRAEGLAMLARLSGRSHRVFTGVALVYDSQLNRRQLYRLNDSRVGFRTIAPAEAAHYWDSGEPADKAGGYAIQGLGAVFVCALEGSYSGVMGLPLFETAELLREAGIDVLG